MPTDTRERRIREAVACPLCGAPKRQPCRAGTHPHNPTLGEDLRAILGRCHGDRRLAWLESKRAAELRTGRALAALRPPPADQRPDISREPQFVGDESPGAMTSIELWMDGQPIATLHAGRGHIDIVCAPGWHPTWKGLQRENPRAGIIGLAKDPESV